MRSMARVVVLGTAILALSCTGAHADGPEGTIEFLEGGSLSSQFHMNLGFLYGTGSRPDGLGTPVSTVRAGVASVGGNPAGLAYLTQDAVLIDILPPFGAAAGDLVDVEGVAADAIDEALEGHTSYGFEPNYPSLSADVGQQGGVISGAVGIRFGRFVAGAAMEEPVTIGLDMVNTALEAYGETTAGEGEESIDIGLRCMADAAADLTFAIDRTTLAAASEIYPDVSVGISVSRYQAAARMTGNVKADGIISYGGQEYAFNDPNDPWDNDLGVSAWGRYQGSGWGWGLGASWRALDWVTVDASFSGVPELRLDGSLTTIENMMAGGDDFELSEVSPAEPTLTERTETVENDPVTLRLPSHAGLAVSLETGFMLTTLEYRRYSGSFGFEFQDVSEGVEISDGFGVEFDFGGVLLGGGVIRGSLMGEAVTDGSSGDDIMIPLANLGLGMDIGENMRVDTMVLAAPLQVLRISLGYEF